MRASDWLVKNATDWNSALATMAIRGLGIGVNFGTLAITARWAGQESLGTIIALNGAAFLGGGICSLGMPTLMLKTLTGHLLSNERSLAAGHYQRGLRVSLLGSLGAVVICSIVGLGQKYGFLPSTLGSIGPTEAVALGVCSAGMAVQFVAFSALRALKLPAVSGILQFCAPPVLLLCALSFIRITTSSISPRGAVLALTCSLTANAVIAHLVVQMRLFTKVPQALEPISWSETKSYWVLTVLSSGSSNILLLLAAIMLDPLHVALIGVPFRICNLPMTIVAALGSYYAPVVREAYLQKNHTDQKKALTESQWIGILLVFPVFLAALTTPDLVLGLFGIHDALAAQLFLLFALSQVVVAGCGVCEQYLAMVEEAGIAARITTISFVGMLVTVSFVLLNWGALAGSVVWAGLAVSRQIVLRTRCR